MAYRTGREGEKVPPSDNGVSRDREGRREAFRGGERRNVEFQWRIKMRCLDENEKISGHGRADGRPFKL